MYLVITELNHTSFLYPKWWPWKSKLVREREPDGVKGQKQGVWPPLNGQGWDQASQIASVDPMWSQRWIPIKWRHTSIKNLVLWVWFLFEYCIRLFLVMRERNETWIKFSPRRKFINSQNLRKGWINTWHKKADRQVNYQNKWILKLQRCHLSPDSQYCFLPKSVSASPTAAGLSPQGAKNGTDNFWVLYQYIFNLQKGKSLILICSEWRVCRKWKWLVWLLS